MQPGPSTLCQLLVVDILVDGKLDTKDQNVESISKSNVGGLWMFSSLHIYLNIIHLTLTWTSIEHGNGLASKMVRASYVD